MRLFQLSIVVVMSWSAGCSPVIVNEPIGKPVVIDAKQIVELTGRWQVGDHQFIVEHVKGNRFKATRIQKPNEGKDGPKFFLLHHTDKDHVYMHVEEKDELQKKMRYMLLRVGHGGGKQIVLFMANVHSFAKAVVAGELKGEVQRDDNRSPTSVKLSSSKSEIEKWLKDQPNEPFLLNHVAVCTKLKQVK